MELFPCELLLAPTMHSGLRRAVVTSNELVGVQVSPFNYLFKDAVCQMPGHLLE